MGTASRGGRGDRRGRDGPEPLPRPVLHAPPAADRRAVRGRAVAQVAVGNGSCEILLAAAEALCEPGDEILFAWPSFSIYPHLAALTGAREIRVPLAEGYVHDLDAMLAEITAATQLVCVSNPNNPTGTHLPAARIAEFLERGPAPRHGRARRGLHRVPDERRPRRHRRPPQAVPEPRPPADVQQGLRPRRACAAATRWARRSSARRSTPSGSRSASTSSRRSRRPRRSSTATTSLSRVERTIVERVFVEEGVRDLGLEPPDSQANFSWIPLGDRDEAEVIQQPRRARGSWSAAARSLGGPGHIRVTYGTRGENERFLDALEAAVCVSARVAGLFRRAPATNFSQ